MGNKLEQLLNTLIQKGWKPFGKGGLNLRKLSGIHKGWLLLHEPSTRVADNYSLRDLVSKSSGLWKFCVENGMVKHDQYTNTTRIQEYEDERDSETYRTKYDEGSYLFRLIESSLKDESELESFILDNIKVEG